VFVAFGVALVECVVAVAVVVVVVFDDGMDDFKDDFKDDDDDPSTPPSLLSVVVLSTVATSLFEYTFVTTENSRNLRIPIFSTGTLKAVLILSRRKAFNSITQAQQSSFWASKLLLVLFLGIELWFPSLSLSFSQQRLQGVRSSNGMFPTYTAQFSFST
jgi:hypothetical protein